MPTAACSERNSTEQSVALRDELLAPVTATLKQESHYGIDREATVLENSKRLEKYYTGEEEGNWRCSFDIEYTGKRGMGCIVCRHTAFKQNSV